MFSMCSIVMHFCSRDYLLGQMLVIIILKHLYILQIQLLLEQKYIFFLICRYNNNLEYYNLNKV